jgi:hypothetical protein
MHTLEPPTPCPTCGSTDVNSATRTHAGVITADIICDQGHPYTVRWMVAV